MGKKTAVVIAGCILLLGGLCGAAENPRPLSGKNVLMVIAPSNFRDEELSLTRDLLEKKGARITVASTTRKAIKGMLGMKVRPDGLLKDSRAADYDAVVFVGGGGARALFENTDAHRLARNAWKHGKVLAAICIAPCILAKAGVLKGHNATVFPGRQFVLLLRQGGATYVRGKAVVEDGRLVTANGPNASARFGDAIVRALVMPFKDDPEP